MKVTQEKIIRMLQTSYSPATQKVGDARALASVIGEDELSPLDKTYLKFGQAFEHTFVGQGEDENRSIVETLDLGWKLLRMLRQEKNLTVSIRRSWINIITNRGEPMDPNTFPTKGNLILAKNSLALAKQGYVLMDKKRNILIRELMGLIQQAESIQKEIDSTFRMAYAALQMANIKLGISLVEEISYSVPVEDSIRIRTRSIMGTEIPLVEADTRPAFPTYAYYSTNIALDQAKASFEKVKAAFHQAFHDRKFSLPAGKQYQNPEACQRSEKYYHPTLYRSYKRHSECTGRKRA